MSESSSSAAIIKEALDNAVSHHQAGRLSEAEELYRAILSLDSQHADANYNLGLLAVQLGQASAALPFLNAALTARPQEPGFWTSYIEALLASGEVKAAHEVLTLARQRGIKLPTELVKGFAEETPPAPSVPPASQPSNTEQQALAAAFQKRDFSTLEQLGKAAAQKYPHALVGWRSLSLAYFNTNRFEEALAPTLKMVELQPDDAQMHANLGLIFWQLRRLADAEACFLHALAMEPNVSDTHTNLGNVRKDQGREPEAITCYRRAIELDPKQAIPYSNLGALLINQQNFREAENCFRTALQLEKNNPFALRNLSTVLAKLGHLSEAEAVIRQAITIDPENVLAHDLLLFLLNYTHIDKSGEARKLAEQYGTLVARRRRARYNTWNTDTEPQRLKVGIVSADLKNHPVGLFVESLVANMDSERIELIAYVHMAEQKYDAVTARLHPHFAGWRSIYRLSDQDTAALIHADGIHVLLDLSGHTSDNRLPVFAYKAAPVQASWLGYFATTGVAEMDYLVGDPYLCPPQEENHFTEKVWRLPQTWLSFTPPQLDVQVAPTPALSQGYITFGSFNNLNKMNDAVVALWSDVLKHLPTSRLFLKAPQLGDPKVQAETLARFAAHGIQEQRLHLEGPSPRPEYLQTYARVDIALDPFPYPGGATSVDALWMGVPILTLRGNRFLAHLGESVAKNAGLDEWIANDKADYIAKAATFASDLPALAHLRSELRNRLQQSPLLDTQNFAKGFEEALWAMWAQRSATPAAPDVLKSTPIAPSEISKLQRLLQQGKYAELQKHAQILVRKYPDADAGWRALSQAHYHLGHPDAALQAAQKLLALQPSDAAAHGLLGLIFIGQKNFGEAASSLTRAIELDPEQPDPYVNLAYIHRNAGDLGAAIKCYQQAIAINPLQAATHANLGIILLEQLQLRAAETSFRTALSLAPNNPAALLGLGSILVKLGLLGEAEALMRRLIKLEPDNTQAYDTLLFLLNYKTEGYSEEAKQLAVRYGKMLTRKAAKQYKQWLSPVEPTRLKVGIVSGDLYNHPVGYFLESLLQALDPTRIEVIAYSNRPTHKSDATSIRLQAYCSDWKSIYGLDDASAAALIHADGVHILLDLAGHTGNTRLPVFAFKPAPIQAAWLGYFATTGVEQMDYLIGDPNVCPPAEEKHFTETIWRLPETYLCFTPPDADIAVSDLPALANRYITFGCFNNVGKLTDAVIKVWSSILAQVPNSRLMLKARQLGDYSMRMQLQQRFMAQGIAEDRLILEGPTPRQDYLRAYQRLDIVLDPFPYPGGTTTMEALWMSVPVLTLRGNRMLSHAGENIMRNIGLPEWIAEDTTDYIAKAIAFAADEKALAILRQCLREKVLGSPMFDAPRFARHFEVALWDMWAQRQPS